MDFLLVTAFWGDGHHWYLVSKGQGCYCTPENGFLKTVQCTGQRPPPPHTKNDPAQIVNGAKDKKKQCMSSPPGTFVSSPNPPHSATQAFPSPAPAPHPTLLILSLSLLTDHQHHRQSDKVWECSQERGHIWRESSL